MRLDCSPVNRFAIGDFCFDLSVGQNYVDPGGETGVWLEKVLRFFRHPENAHAIVDSAPAGPKHASSPLARSIGPIHFPGRDFRGKGMLVNTWMLGRSAVRLFRSDKSWSIHVEVVPVGDAVFDEGIRELVESTVVNMAVANSPTRVWIHGACLARAEGNAPPVVLVGPGGMGKTTLTMGMLHDGYRLLTDDVLLFAPEQRQILPFPRCPKFKPGSLELLAGIGFHLAEIAELLGRYIILPTALVLTKPVALPARIVFLSRDSADAAGLHEIDISQALRGLIRHSNLLRMDSSLLLATSLLDGSRFYRLRVGDFRENVAALSALS